MLLLLQQNLGFAWGAIDAPPVVVETGQTPAGRKRRKKKYVVEIDGQQFVLDNMEQAQVLLSKAKELAQLTAKAKADEVLTRVAPAVIRLGKVKPITIKAPVIRGPDELVGEARDEIRKIYVDAAVAAELRLLLMLQQIRDDEEAILLLLQ